MDPRRLEEDEYLLELDIRDIDPSDPKALDKLFESLNGELKEQLPLPMKMHSNFGTVTKEVSALSWKLSTILIKSGDSEELLRNQSRLLHLLARIYRLEPNAGGHAAVNRLKQEISQSLSNLEQYTMASHAINVALKQNEVSKPTVSLTPQNSTHLPAPEQPNESDVNASGQLVTTDKQQHLLDKSIPDSFGHPNNSPVEHFNFGAQSIPLAELRRCLNPMNTNLFRQPPPVSQLERPAAPGGEAHSSIHRPPGCGPRAEPNEMPNITRGWCMDKWPLRFGGTPKDLPVDEFLFRVETLARLSNVSQAALTLGLHQLLVGAASSWYWVFIRNQPNATWAQIREALVIAFQSNVSDAAIRRLIMDRLQRPGERFMEFTLAVQELEVRLINRMTEHELMETFRRNMLPHLQDRLLFLTTNTIRELQLRVQEVEDLAQRQHEVQQVRRSMARVHEIAALSPPPQEFGARYQQDFLPHSSFDYPPRTSVNNYGSDFVAENEDVRPNYPHYQGVDQTNWLCGVTNPLDRNQLIICWNCDEMGHTFLDCLAKRNIFCYGCGAKNYVRPQCPKCAPRSLLGNGWRGARPPQPQQSRPPPPPGPALPQKEHPRRPL